MAEWSLAFAMNSNWDWSRGHAMGFGSTAAKAFNREERKGLAKGAKNEQMW
jgi:hypothetical protein